MNIFEFCVQNDAPWYVLGKYFGYAVGTEKDQTFSLKTPSLDLNKSLNE